MTLVRYMGKKQRCIEHLDFASFCGLEDTDISPCLEDMSKILSGRALIDSKLETWGVLSKMSSLFYYLFLGSFLNDCTKSSQLLREHFGCGCLKNLAYGEQEE